MILIKCTIVYILLLSLLLVSRLIAGCTSVVALKYGNQLIVANAGDSRAVLCRANGEAYALSEDHKPHEVCTYMHTYSNLCNPPFI